MDKANMDKTESTEAEAVPLTTKSFSRPLCLSCSVIKTQWCPLLQVVACLVVPFLAILLSGPAIVQPGTQISGMAVSLTVFYIVALAWVLFMLAVLPTAIFHAVACHLLGIKSSIRAALKAAWRAWRRVLATTCAVFTVTFLATCAVSTVFFFIAVYLVTTAKPPLLLLNDDVAQLQAGKLSPNMERLAALVVPLIAVQFIVQIFISYYLRVRYAFAVISSVAEPQSWGFRALGRSASLVRKLKLKLLMLMLTTGFLCFFVLVVYAYICFMYDLALLMHHWSSVPLPAAGIVATMSVLYILEAALFIVFTVYYFRARCLHSESDPYGRLDRAMLIRIVDGDEEYQESKEVSYKLVELDEV